MTEFIAISPQNVALNAPIIFNASISCRKGYVVHEDGTGIFILRGITDNCFARYKVTFNGNIAVPEGGTAGAIAVALALFGEERPSSKAIVTPAAVNEFFNVTSTAYITVPRGCCFSLSVDAVPASTDPTVTPAPVIVVQNGNLTINREA